MNRANYYLAQVNIGRLRAPIDDPLISGFAARLEDINASADQSPGFVWRLQTEEGNATYLRPFDDERIIMNMSVWESVRAFDETAVTVRSLAARYPNFPLGYTDRALIIND